LCLILIILFSLLFLQVCGGSNETAAVFSIITSVSSVAFSNEFLQPATHTIAVNIINLSQIPSSADTLAFSTNFADNSIVQQAVFLSNIGADWQATVSAS